MTSITRRHALGLLAFPATALSARQSMPNPRSGMASPHVQPVPRGKPSGIPFHGHFEDVASAAGLTYPVVGGHSGRVDYVIEAMGGGAAFLDYDNDGWLDILVLCGSRFGDPPSDASNRLYKNNRNGTFTDVTKQAGLFRTGYFFGVTVGDYDNDGWDDLFLTGWPQNILYRNNGDGTFTDVTKAAGLINGSSRFGSGCTFIDYNRDGKLDLFVSDYVTFAENAAPRDTALFIGPRGLPYGHPSLYRNNADGTFTDVTEASGIAKASGGYGLTAVAADFDNDGWPDIYLACDSTPSKLFRNTRDGCFVEQGLENGVALSDDGMEQAGMGVAVGDLNLNGNLDIVKTHFAGDRPAVYINDDRGEFRDDVLRAGLGVETRFISWGVGIEDLDNDGSPDIFWATGGIYPELRHDPNEPYDTPRILFRNLGNGRFEELAKEGGPGVMALHCSRGCAFGDFDNDGDIDILIVNRNEPPSLLRNNVTGANHWIKVQLKGTKSNRSAIGARVTVHYGNKIQAKEVLAQSSYLSVNDRRLHFGLGSAAAQVGVQVRWPIGSVETFASVPLDHLIQITEGSGITHAQTFHRTSAARKSSSY
jgi:hypothetical protein